ncbi:protease complex subunit PrcB family protein [Magnetovibrio sp. PR-2]|uniref:protease complex subunit PrcB family protein n=1 Tax=Magnetovibrio sp. PR-2 TaxID=3120356 RepID=UPI002FCE51DE
MLRLISALLSVFVLACATTSLAAGPTNTSQTLQPTKTVEGRLNTPGTPGVYVIRTGHEWREFTHKRKLSWDADIDFNRDMIIAVFLGTHNSAGTHAKISEIRRTDWTVEVTYIEIPPDVRQMHAQVINTPYVISIIPRTDAPVVFSRGHFSTQEVPFDEYDRMMRTLSEQAYQVEDLKRKNDWANGRIQDLTGLLTATPSR